MRHFLFLAFLMSACTDVVPLRILDVPSPPTGVIVSAGYGSITVSWLPNPPEERVRSYRVLGATTSWSIWSESIPGAFASTALECCTFTWPAENERTLFAAVVADNSRLDDSPPSERVSATPPGWRGTRLFGSPDGDGPNAVSADPATGTIFVGGETYGALPGNTEFGDCDIMIAGIRASGEPGWYRQYGTTSCESAADIHVDGAGNAFAIGTTFSGIAGEPAVGGADGWLGKFSSSGSLAWMKVFGTTGNESAFSVSSGAGGAAFVTGSTNGGGLDGNPAFGAADIFLSKYDASGTRIWTRQRGSAANEFGSAVAIDPLGSVFVAGTAYGSLDGQTFGGGTTDAFIMKFDSDGIWQWTRFVGGSSSESAVDVAVDESTGTAYLLGFIPSGALPGNASAGGFDLWVARFDPAGISEWVDQIGTTGNDSGSSILARDGVVFITGQTSGAFVGNNYGSEDGFVLALNSSGDRLWTRQYGSSGFDSLRGISSTPAGPVFVTGFVTSTFDGLSPIGPSDVVLMKLTADGNRL